MKKIVFNFLIFIVVIASLIGTASATNIPLVGTIRFVAINNTDSNPIENLEVSIYQISKQDELGNFAFATGFESCTLDINNLTEGNIENLKNYAKTNAEPIIKKSTDKTGEFYLANMNLGTYLFIQENKTDEIIMQTMLISIPELKKEDGLKYDLTVKPKILNKEIIENKTEVVKDETLPYTGVLNWPIPVLVVAGIAIFCIAWLKVYSTSKKKVD